MSILIDENTKVIVQGITGRDGSFHTRQMLDYGTKIVGGVTPGKGGQSIFDLPVFNSVAEAAEATGATASVVYVPAKFAKGAMLDAAKAPLELLVVITEGVPTLDVLEAYEALQEQGIRLIGPQLSWADFSRKMQNWHYARVDSHPRSGGSNFAQRHVDL